MIKEGLNSNRILNELEMLALDSASNAHDPFAFAGNSVNHAVRIFLRL